MIWQILGSSAVSSILILIFLYLCREWIKTRLKVDIQHEADKKLESFKATLKEQSDAASIILNSQMQNILSVQSTALSSFSYAQRAAMERKLKAVEELWIAISSWRYEFPKILNFFDILIAKEYKGIGSNHEFKKRSQEINTDFFTKTLEIRRNCESHRPFIGQYIWSIFIVYQFIVGRILYLIHQGVEDPSKLEWDKDDSILLMLKSIFDENEVKEFIDLSINKISWLENKFESKFLLSSENIISGKDFGEDALQTAIRIINKLPEIKTIYTE